LPFIPRNHYAIPLGCEAKRIHLKNGLGVSLRHDLITLDKKDKFLL